MTTLGPGQNSHNIIFLSQGDSHNITHPSAAARRLRGHEPAALDEALAPLLEVLRRDEAGPLLRVHLPRLPPTRVVPVDDLRGYGTEQGCEARRILDTGLCCNGVTVTEVT